MSPADIIAEHRLCADLRQFDIDRFAAEGVPALSLARPWVMARDTVVFDIDRFEFERSVRQTNGSAVKAYILLALDEFGDAVDLVAWRPPQIATWLGRAAMLGQEQVCGPRLDEPLQVHRTVLDWFRAERTGVYIIDYGQAADILRTESLVVETAEHARFLRSRLTLRSPPVRVRAGPRWAPPTQPEDRLVMHEVLA